MHQCEDYLRAVTDDSFENDLLRVWSTWATNGSFDVVQAEQKLIKIN